MTGFTLGKSEDDCRDFAPDDFDIDLAFKDLSRRLTETED